MSGVAVRQRKQVEPRWSLSESERNFGALHCSRGMLPLEEIRLQGAIRGMDFTLRLTQVFVNVHQESVEAVYIFPLPARAAVSAFTMKTRDRVIEGELQERGQARANYQEAIQAGHQAALVEEERPEIFTMTLGNIPPQESVTVELVLDGPLTCIDDTALFRFPLVVAPRYIPGQALPGGDVGQGTHHDTDRVPDASRITPPVLLPGYPNPVRLSIEIELDSPLLDWEQLECTLPMQLEQLAGKKRRRSGQSARLLYLPQSGRVDHDFILSFPFHPRQMQTAFQVQEVEGANSSPFCLTLVPPASLNEESPEKQVVILLDRSGSMGGWKMLAAQRTVARLIDSLNSDDSFCVLAFDTVVEEVRPGPLGEAPRTQNWFKLNQTSTLTPATDRNRCDYGQALKAVHARGGTEIAGALEEAIRRLGSPLAGVDRHILLVTDGQVGNEAEILHLLKRDAAGIKVSTIGIDQAVNAAFLEQVAASTSGICQLVQSDDQLDRSMTRICQRIGNPSLCNIQVLTENVSDLVFQHNDLYPGVATRIYGRLQGAVPDSLEIEAVGADGSPHRWTVEVTGCQGTIEKLWARERVLQMEHLFQVGGSVSAEEVTRFSLQYGVLCRFTAFVAIDKESRVEPQQRSLVQAVSQPAGWVQPMPMEAAPLRARPRMQMACPAPAAPPPPPPGGGPALRREASEDRKVLAEGSVDKLSKKRTSAPDRRPSLVTLFQELLDRLKSTVEVARLKQTLKKLLEAIGDRDPGLRQQVLDYLELLEKGPMPDLKGLREWSEQQLKGLQG